MEEEMNREMGLCVLCCDSVNPSTDGDERDTTINKFWKQISSEDGGKVDHLAVCVDCLASVAIATEERGNAEKIEVELRSLQRQVLKLLKELQGCMSGYLSEMRIIEEKIKRSKDTSALETKSDLGRKNIALDAVQLRDGIVKAVKDLNLFQDQLSLKVNLAPNKISRKFPTTATHPIPSSHQIKLEVEDKDEEPPAFYDDDAPSSPVSPDQVETEAEEKVNFNSTNISTEPPRRSLRRPAATAAASRLYADLRRKRHQKGQDPVKSCSKKKTPKVKQEAVLPPEKINLPNWIKEISVKAGHTRGEGRVESRRRYFCELCPSFISKYPYALEQHLREHEQEALSKDIPKSFTCAPCNLSFSLKQLYEYHMSCHDCVFKLYCYLCNKVTPPLEMAAHFKEIHGATKLFQCDNCLFCCTTRDRYLEHLKYTHTGSKVIMSCDLCSEKLHTRKALLRHLYNEHKAFEKLECGIEGCTRTFLDPATRRAHHFVHTKLFPCTLCDKGFSGKTALEQHMSMHTTIRTWECSRCPKAFKSKASLNAHEKLHDRDEATGSGPAYQCHLCEKSFLVKSTLEGHLRMHQGLGYTCDLCGAKFTQKTHLKNHMNTHETGEKCFCEHCGKGFRCLEYLKTHVRTQHDNPKRFECQVCHKMFRDKSNLNQHSVVHTGAKPFQCQICGKGFTQSHTLKHHKKHSHPDEQDATNN